MPGVFTIPPDVSFVDALAKGVLDEAGESPQALLDYTILLPTRRACRSLRDAFLRAGDGAAMLLPLMRPLGDVDEDELILQEMPDFGDHAIPPAIPGLRRRLLLARLILGWESTSGTMAVDQAAQLAGELERLLDQVQTERLSFDGLKGLAPEVYATHWQKVLDFLKILTEHWPAIIAEQGGIDPADRRNRLLDTLSRTWSKTPPAGHVIAAGSTGTIPATADLLATIADMPNGRVVLPGLMRDIDAESWQAIEKDPSHPQHNLARLINRLALAPHQVADWPHRAPAVSRTTLIAEVMRPAETTRAWRDLNTIPAGTLDNVERVDCTDSAEEASIIALILREALETPQKTAALVTPDRALARRVAGELRRWNIEINDTAGESLATTVPGSFLRLIVTMIDSGFAPAPLLSVLKHPLAAIGMPTTALRGAARALERMVLRGPRPGAGIAGLRAALALRTDETGELATIAALLDRLDSITEPLTTAYGAGACDLGKLLKCHILVAEALAATDLEAGDSRLWTGDAGEMLARFVAELSNAAELIESVPTGSYGALLESIMAGATVRPRFGLHPRLTILGLLEARLQHADLIVLGGLNEGVWPPDPQSDPWLSRPMREAFGLPLPERRIGLTAHDFVQAFAAPEIILTRASKTDGQPTVPSRWLTRLDTVLRSTDTHDTFYASQVPWRGLRNLLNKPDGSITIAPAAPRPPIQARPRRLSVTQIETWMRDPYAIYARHILRLRPLDPIDADPGAAQRGTFIHDALDSFVKAYPEELPEDALRPLLKFGEDAFGDALGRPAVRAFWWPRFVRIAHWFIALETERRRDLAFSVSEASGKLSINGPEGPFVLSAKADRIDRLHDGSYEIIDYKTGAVPTRDDIRLGFSPQLALEAAILQESGFGDLSTGSVRRLAYWRLSGGETPGKTSFLPGDVAALSEAALDGVRNLVTAFDDQQTPYAAAPRPGWALRFNDYAHLARILEWSNG